MFVCETGGMVVICAGTTGYNATVDLRYLWMRQKRVQGSHFANDEQCYAMNELALAGKLDACASRIFPYDELPLAHQLMHDNQHPHGNMAVLVGATDFGLGKTAAEPIPHERAVLPPDDVHDTPRPYPLSVPLADVADAPKLNIVDDGSKVRDRMHKGFISCTKADSVGQAAKTMIENDIHALVVTEGDDVVGVLSQTDLVLARQGRTVEDARKMTVGEIMTEGCATCEADTPMSEAISRMMKLRIHRLLVTEKDKPVGVLSMTDIVRKLMSDS